MATKPKATFWLTEFKYNDSPSKIMSRTCFYGPLKECELFGPAQIYFRMEMHYEDNGEVLELKKQFEKFHEPPTRQATNSKHSWGAYICRQYKGSFSKFMADFTREEAALAALLPQM